MSGKVAPVQLYCFNETLALIGNASNATFWGIAKYRNVKDPKCIVQKCRLQIFFFFFTLSCLIHIYHKHKAFKCCQPSRRSQLPLWAMLFAKIDFLFRKSLWPT